MKRKVILLFIFIIITVVAILSLIPISSNDTLKKICDDSGYSLELNAYGSNGEIVYLAQKSDLNHQIKIAVHNDCVQFIEVEAILNKIDDKLKFQESTLALISDIVSECGNKICTTDELKMFLMNKSADEAYNEADMIVEKFENDKYYCLMSINSLAAEYKEGEPILERFVITVNR